MDRSVIIIGAGIAGLSAGCYLRMNGYRTHIVEMHTLPGGLCTSWHRKGYTIDGCMHWLVGSGPGSSMHRVWQELGVIDGLSFYNHDQYARVEGADGRCFALYTDPDQLGRHMKELAPEDGKVIDEFVGALRKLKGFDMPVGKPPELENPLDKLRGSLAYVRYLGVLGKWRKATVGDYAARFKNEFLRESFLALADGSDGFPMFALLMPMAWVQAKTAGYPLGGSLELARAIEKRYVGLGGELTYGARVEKVLVEQDRAVGVRLAGGTELRADVVISAADGHATIFDMLEGRYLNDTIRGYYDTLPLFPPLLQVSFGVARSFDDVPRSVGGVNLPLETPITIAGKAHHRFTAIIYHHDPSLAPAGKSVVKFMPPTEYGYWEKLYADPDAYRAEKERLADAMLAALERRFPGISAQVEMRDVATPMTWVRYTGNWRGSFEGWMISMETWGLRMSKTLPGLQDFYMVGQWVEPGGGLPPAATSGRAIAQMLCKKDGKRFVATR